jgi:uncharacterized protein YodC (DUF2158 family)
MAKLRVGTEVKHGRSARLMIITGFDGEYACCEWIDKEGVKHSKRYGKLAAARSGPAPRGEG